MPKNNSQERRSARQARAAQRVDEWERMSVSEKEAKQQQTLLEHSSRMES